MADVNYVWKCKHGSCILHTLTKKYPSRCPVYKDTADWELVGEIKE